MESHSQCPIVANICAMFQTLKETKKKKTLMNTLSKIFCVLCQEKMKRKLLYTCKIENEERLFMDYFFKNDNIIIDVQKEKPLKDYEKWINGCFEKYVHLLLQLLHNEDEILVKKSLSVLFACLQCESRIFQKLQNKDKEEEIGMDVINKESKIKFFPLKLYIRIVTSLLRVKTFSTNLIKHICKNYICSYYDLNYFFLLIFKNLSIEKEKLKQSGTTSVGEWRRYISEKSTNGVVLDEIKQKGIRDKENELDAIFNKDSDMNIFLYSVLINSVKPNEKEDPTRMRKMKFIKQSRIEFCFNLDEDERMRRKRTFDEMSKNLKNTKKGIWDKKDTLNYDSDDSIIHLSSSDSDETIESETFLDKIEITEKEDKDNDEYVSDSNLSEEFRNEYSEIIDEEIKKMSKNDKFLTGVVDRKQNLFLNIPVNEKLYANVYSRSWFYFITLFNHNCRMTLHLLHSIPSYIFPYTNNRYYLIDFFNYSFYCSSNLYVSLAALPGIFYILTKLNIGDIVENKEEYSTSDDEEESEQNNEAGDTESEEISEEVGETEGEKEEKEEEEEEEETEEETEEEAGERENGKRSQVASVENFKLNRRMYTDYYQRLYELITPASFYYRNTDFLKIIFTSLKNKMIPLQYVTSFLKKLLRVACLTSNNISINILCVVYDILSFFKNELHDVLIVSPAFFMNLDIKKDLFCYENLNKNCDRNEIKEMFKREVIQANQKNVEKQTQHREKEDNKKEKGKEQELVQGQEQEQEEEQEQEKVIAKFMIPGENVAQGQSNNDNKVDNSGEFSLFPDKDKQKTYDCLEKTVMKEIIKGEELFSLQDCLPEKYKINVMNIDDAKLHLVNQIFYEIILLNNHLCYNLRQYSNIYYFGFKKKSSNMLDFYVDPNEIDWKPENAFFFYLKEFLNLKEKKDVDVLPFQKRNSFSMLFI